jgi:ProP effector
MSGRSKMAAHNTIATLTELFPGCFFNRRRKPLKVGIHDEVLAALAGSGTRPALAGATAKQVGLALKIYTSNSGYLRCIREGAGRVGLGGEVTGHVTADEAENAKQRLAQRAKPAIKAKPASETRSPQAIRPNKPVAPRLGLEAGRARALADLKAAARRRAG